MPEHHELKPLVTDNPEEIETYAEMLLHEYDLHDWGFEWMRGKKRLGQARYDVNPFSTEPTHMIRLSKPVFLDLGMERLIELGCPEYLLEDVLRHEIAHALDHRERGTSDHGPHWKYWAKQVNAMPEAKRSDVPYAVRMAMANWRQYCKRNMCFERYLHQKPTKRGRHYHCGTCGGDIELERNPEQDPVFK